MIQSTQAGGGLFVTHWNMQSLMQLLTEADDEMVSSDEDEDVAPNERPLWIEGRGLIMFGQHKVGINGAREADNLHAKFPGLTFLREHFRLTYKDVHSYTFNLLRFLEPFLNYLADDMRRATVMEGMTPAPLRRSHNKLATRNASEVVNERCALAIHPIICSGEVWNAKCSDVLATPRTAQDMTFEAAYEAVVQGAQALRGLPCVSQQEP